MAALSQLRNDVLAMQAAWTAYTPVWTASTTGPTLGNGTLTGAYRQVGKTWQLRIVLTIGSTTTVATGNWRFSLPFTPKLNGLLGAYMDDASASKRWAGLARITAAAATGDNMRIAPADNSTTVMDTNPFVWASGDVLILSGVLEEA